MSNQGYASYNYSYVYGQEKRKHPIVFSHKEVQHTSIAAALVLGIGFSILIYQYIINEIAITSWNFAMMSFFATFMMVSFLTHEFAHKIMAQKSGLWAECRLTTWGAVLTFASVFLPLKIDSARSHDDRWYDLKSKYLHLSFSVKSLKGEERAVLRALAVRSTKDAEMNAGEVYKAVKESMPIGYTRYDEIIRKFDAMWLINLQYRNGKGRTKVISLRYDPAKITEYLG